MNHEPDDPTRSVHEVLRYGRADETRVYTLIVRPSGVELWRNTEVEGEPATAILEEVFTGSDLAGRAIEDIETSLRAGGWKVM